MAETRETQKRGRGRLVRLLACCGVASVLVVGVAGPAWGEDRKERQPTKRPPASQVYRCKKGGKKVQATSLAAAAVACRGYGGVA